MMLGGGLAAGAGTLALLFGSLPAPWQSTYFYAFIFLLIGFARAGVRLECGAGAARVIDLPFPAQQP